MNSKNPRKKLDFFNGGRGVDLSQFEKDDNLYETADNYNNESMEEEPTSPEANNNDPSLTDQYPQATPSWSNYEQTYSPSPPLYSSQSPTYVHAPVPQYYTPAYNTLESPDHVTSHFHMGHFPPHLPTQNIQMHPFTHPHPIQPPPIQNSSLFPGTSTLFSEPSFSGFLNSATYSPLRPMDPNGMNMGFCDPLHGMDSSGINNGRESEASRKKRQQKCSLCSNHGTVIDVKGHKWFCPYRNCNCDRCTITRGRQHHMKEQQKLTRHLQRLQ